MYVERIKYQTEKDGDWETGYYIGRFYNSEEATFLDNHYKPVMGDIWNYTIDNENRLVLSAFEKEDFEWINEK